GGINLSPRSVSVGDKGARYGAKTPTATKTSRIENGRTRIFRRRSRASAPGAGDGSASRASPVRSDIATSTPETEGDADSEVPRPIFTARVRPPARDGCGDRPRRM